MNLCNKLGLLRDEAVAYIESVIDKRGPNYELCPPEDEDGTWEELHGMPSTIQIGERYGVTTHNIYFIYNVTRDTEGNNGLIFDGYDNEIGEDETFRPEVIETEILCAIADHIYELENPTL